MRLALILTVATLLATVVLAAYFLSAPQQQCGVASWYALTSQTASGERMDPAEMTAAHRTLPIGTMLKINNPKNGKSVVVRVNDRGPFVKGRVLDLSRAAARDLGFLKAGHTEVCFFTVR